jgi:cobalt/nickel transport system permease protein
MHFDAFDRYHHHDSRIHRLDPRVKVLVTMLFIVSNALLPDGAWLAFGVAWLVLLGSNDLAQLGLWYTFQRSFVALPFALAAISAIFSPLGHPLAQWNIFGLALVPTDVGLIKFFSIIVRSWLSVQMAILLVTTTLFPDLIHALEHLRVPRVLTTIIAFLYRYLFVLTDEVFRVLRAREARSAARPGHTSGGSVLWRARVVGNMAGQLFIRSYERSDRIYNAMLARGYTGHLRTLNPHIMQRRDWWMLAFFGAALFLIQLVGWIK